MFSRHLDKRNLHHAYLIEGSRSLVVPEIIEFCESIDIKTTGNPDFCHMVVDSFKIEDAFLLRDMSKDKPFSSSKKIFIISINNITLDAQNVLLKMFEEGADNTHFFLVVSDVNSLLSTLVSRFYFISTKSDMGGDALGDAEKFIKMPLQKRLDFVKNLLVEEDITDENGNELPSTDGARSKALKFLNALEFVLHDKLAKNFSGLTLPEVSVGTYTVQNSLQVCLQHLFKVRKSLRMPGSSTKMLLESVALIVPDL